MVINVLTVRLLTLEEAAILNDRFAELSRVSVPTVVGASLVIVGSADPPLVNMPSSGVALFHVTLVEPLAGRQTPTAFQLLLTLLTLTLLTPMP